MEETTMINWQTSLRSTLAAAFLVAAATAQNTWYVDVSGTPPGSGTMGDPYTSIQYAIAQPRTYPGDTILVHPGTYLETVDYMDKDLELRSLQGAAVTTIDGQQGGSTVTVSGDSLLDGFTIRGGTGTPLFSSATFGGGIFVGPYYNRATIENCIVRDNTAADGGGIGIYNAMPMYIRDCVIEDNQAVDGGGGGAAAFMCALWVDRCVFRNNRCAGRGGGLLAYDTDAWLAECNLEDNTADSTWSAGLPSRGGAVYAEEVTCGTAVHLQDCVVQRNAALGQMTAGGGLAYGSANGQIVGCSILDNVAGDPDPLGPAGMGGGIASIGVVTGYGGSISVSDTLIRGNLGQQAGGGAYSEVDGFGAGWAAYSGCTFQDNRSSTGGAAYAAPTSYPPILQDCAVFWNQAVSHTATPSRGGGAVGFDLDHCVLYENLADEGAGVAGSSLEHCTVFNNQGAGMWEGTSAHNSILRGNQGAQIVGSPAVTWCNVQGGWPGLGNIDAPELWWAPFGGPAGGHDFHFSSLASPGIGAGEGGSDLGPFPWHAGWCPSPAIYCTAKISSASCLPEIYWTGEPRLTGPDSFRIRAREILRNKNAIFFWGRSLGSLPPFQGGFLCAAPPLRRTPVQKSTDPGPPECSGALSFHFSHAYMVSEGIVTGDEVYGQYWYRDPQDPVYPTGLTDAIWFIVGP